MIVLTIAIYIRAGKDIFRKRRQLNNFSSNGDGGTTIDNPFEIHASKVIQVTSEASEMTGRHDPSTRVGSEGNLGTKRNSDGGDHVYNSYSVTVERGDAIPMTSIMKADNPVVSSVPRRSPRTETNAAAFAYCKYAMLYFVALLVTWVSLLYRHWYLFENGHALTFLSPVGSIDNQPSIQPGPSRLSQLRPGVHLGPGSTTARLLEQCDLHRHLLVDDHRVRPCKQEATLVQDQQPAGLQKSTSRPCGPEQQVG